LLKSLQDFNKQEIMACYMLFKSLQPFVYLRKTLHALSAYMGIRSIKQRYSHAQVFYYGSNISKTSQKDIRLTKTKFLYLVFTINVTPNKNTKQSSFVRDVRPILCFFIKEIVLIKMALCIQTKTTKFIRDL